MRDFGTRTEYVDGIPYQVRVRPNVDKRREEKKHKGPTEQDKMHAVVISVLNELHKDRAPDAFTGITVERGFGMSGFSLSGVLNVFGKKCPPADTSADAEPAMDGWGPDCYWEGQDWIDWHKNNITTYGQDKANAKFLQFWGRRSAFGHELTLAQNEPLKSYIAAQGFDKSSTDLKIIEGTDEAGQKVVKTGGAVVDTVTKVAKGAGDTATGLDKLIKWAPYLIGGSLLLFIFAWTFVSISNKKLATVPIV